MYVYTLSMFFACEYCMWCLYASYTVDGHVAIHSFLSLSLLSLLRALETAGL